MLKWLSEQCILCNSMKSVYYNYWQNGHYIISYYVSSTDYDIHCDDLFLLNNSLKVVIPQFYLVLLFEGVFLFSSISSTSLREWELFWLKSKLI